MPREMLRGEGWSEPVCKVLLATLLFLLAQPAQAQSTPKARNSLTSVSRLYEELEYEQALGQIARARRHPLTVEENVTLSLYEGIILADMNRWDESADAFKAALTLDPTAKLPVKVSPKVAQHLEEARQQVQSDLAQTKPPGKPPTPPLARPDTRHPPAETPPEVKRLTDGQKATLENSPSTPLTPAAVPTATTQESSSRLLRSQVLIPAVAGGVLVLAGGASWAMSRQQLSQLRANDPSLATRQDAHVSASRGQTYQSLGMGLLGAGLVGLGVSTALYFGQQPHHQEVTLGISTDGTSAFVHGRWP